MGIVDQRRTLEGASRPSQRIDLSRDSLTHELSATITGIARLGFNTATPDAQGAVSSIGGQLRTDRTTLGLSVPRLSDFMVRSDARKYALSAASPSGNSAFTVPKLNASAMAILDSLAATPWHDVQIDQPVAPRLQFHVGPVTAPLNASADQLAMEMSAPGSDDGVTESYLPTNPQDYTDGGTLELDGVSSVVSADVGGFTYVFVSGGIDDGISVFRLNANGTLTPVYDVTDGGTLELDGARGLSTTMVDGNTYLFAAGFSDNGVSAFRVNTNGTLTAVADVNDDATFLLAGASDTAAVRVGAFTYLFVAGQVDNGISSFRVAGDGRLTSVANIADNGTLELAGARTVTTVTVGGTAYLIVGGGVDDGLSVFSVSAAGALTNVSNVDDSANANYRLNGVIDITTAVIGGTTYVYAAGLDDNGVTVFSLNAAGVLTYVDNEVDTIATLISGANSVAVHTVGSASFLLVGGSENGLSVYRIENGSNSGMPAGSLTWLDNIADSGSRELAGVVSVASGNVGGTSYIIGGGQTDDGISTFGSAVTGQLYFFGQGDPTDARLAYVNNDGGNQTSFVDNNPTVDLVTGFPEEVGVDTAAGFYFALVNGNPALGNGARLVRGSLSGGAVTTLVSYDGADNIIGNDDDEIVNALQVDVINHKIYVGIQDSSGGAPGATGIRQYSYNPVTGAITDLGFLVTVTSSGKPAESGFSILDVRDFDLDSTNGTLVFTELLTGGVSANGIFRLNLSTPNTVVQLVSQAQFPDSGSAGYITDVEVDSSTHLAYFSVESQHAFPDAGYVAGQNAIYWISDTATNGTATLLTLAGLPGGNHFYPGDMVFDQGTRQLYVESEETDDGSGADTDDVIYVFQLDGTGHSATLINTISLTPSVVNIAANIGGMIFNSIPVLASVNGTGTHAGEQAASGITLLTGAPTITDVDGDHLSSATVQITQGLFSSNDSNATDDRLFYGPTQALSGSVAGTSITWAYNTATNTLTFTGYDTLANYQAALAGVRFQSFGDNPTNYGLNPTRTITWTVSDGAIGVPGGSQNSATTSITIDAVNDAPVNTIGGTLATAEDLTGVVVSGISVSDPDANPGITDITVTLTVQHGTITLSTAVAGGITAGDITGGANGSATITITATANEINATLAGSGLTYTPTGDYNGADTLQIVTNDGGNTGTGGALSDTDSKTITISAVNDAPTVAGDGTEDSTTILEDQASATGDTINALFAGQYSDARDNQIPNGGASSPGAFSGIAVIANGSTAGTGAWQYFNGATWIDIGTVSLSAAKLFTNTTALRFNPALNYNGAEPTLTVRLIDNSLGFGITNAQVVDISAGGATGGTTAYSSGSVVLGGSITAVNDAPVNTVGGILTVAEDSGATNVTGMSISDVDANPATDVFTVTLDVLHGKLNVSTGVAGGVGAGGVAGNASATVTLTGTINQINATLAAAAGLTYTPTGNYNGSDRVQITTDDGGATGLDPGATGTATSEADIDSKTINVTAVNDPVTGTAPATLTLAEDATNVAVTGLSISDVDATLNPSGVYDVTLSATNGTLTMTTLTGLTFTVGDGTADATMTFHGTLAAINTALATAGYTPTGNYNGSATITLGVTDTFGGIVATGTGAATSDSDVVNVTVTAVNDPISTNAPATLTLAEDATNVAVAGLSISDVDATLAPAGVYEVTLSATHGLLTLTTLTGLTFTVGDGTADATMTFHGTLADINTALATAKYTPDANYNGAATITLSATDTFGGIVATGTGSATSDSDVVNVTVTAVNDTPVVAVQASVASTEQVAGFIDPAATISDVDLGALNDYGGSALTVGRNGGAQAQDLLTFGASGAFTVNGANLEAGGLVFATFTGGNGANLVISFTASGTPATQALVNAVVQSLQYTYTGDTPPASIVMNYSFNDGAPGNAGQGGGGTPIGTDAITINITDTPENVAPTLDLDADNSNSVGTGYTAAFTEGGAAVLITDGDVAIADADAGDMIEGATIAINGPVAGDLLTLGAQGSFVVTGSGTGTITITGTGTAAQYQAMLEQITFSNGSDDPGTTRTINITVTDGELNSNIAVATINITAINDKPTLTATGGTPTFIEGAAAADLFSAVTASTIEAGQTFASLTLTVSNVTNGAAEILRVNGIDVALINGNVVNVGVGSATVTLAGGTATLVLSAMTLNAGQLQTLIDGLGYLNSSENPTDADRVVTLTQVTDSGSSTSPNDNATTLNIAATVNVDPVNDAPSGTNATFNVIHGTPHVMTIADFGFSDVENDAFVSVIVASTPTVGRLLYVSGSGLTTAVTVGQVITTADIAAGKLIYKPTPGVNDAATGSFTFRVQDDGGTSNGGVDTDQSPNTLTFTVQPNSAPAGQDSTIAVSHGTPHVMALADFGFSDPDGNAFASVTIDTVPTVGRLLYITAGGAAVAVTVNQVITAADITAGKLIYKPTPGAGDPAIGSFTFQVHDDGGTANGGVDTDPTPNTLTFDANSSVQIPFIEKSAADHGSASVIFGAIDAAVPHAMKVGDAFDMPLQFDHLPVLIAHITSDNASTFDVGGTVDSFIANGDVQTVDQTVDFAPFTVDLDRDTDCPRSLRDRSYDLSRWKSSSMMPFRHVAVCYFELSSCRIQHGTNSSQPRP